VPINRLSGLDFYAAAQHSAVFNGEAFGLQISGDVACAPELNLLTSNDFAVDAAADDHLARKNVGLYFAVGADRQAPATQIHFAFKMAVNEKIFGTGNLTFDANALADTG
jgi:hypothetical protein